MIGEASNRIMQLDPSMRDTAPALWQQFRDAYDMRIILTHEYFRIDAGIVWTTVRGNLPVLKGLLSGFSAGNNSEPS